MKLLKASALVTGFLASAITLSPAYAAQTFDWALSGPAASLGGFPLLVNGQLTATLSSTPGVFQVNTLTLDGSSTNALISFDGSDNKIYANGFASLDGSGLAFTGPAGQSVDVFSFFSQGSIPTGNAYGEIASPGGFGVGTFTLTAVPEPATWAMLVFGLFGIGFALRKTRA